jgi:hypothetical protein
MLRLEVAVEPNKQHQDRYPDESRAKRFAQVVTSEEEGLEEVSGRRDELRRKSWVIAMPMEAKEREVRSQARKVRSTHQNPISTPSSKRYIYTPSIVEKASECVPKAK